MLFELSLIRSQSSFCFGHNCLEVLCQLVVPHVESAGLVLFRSVPEQGGGEGRGGEEGEGRGGGGEGRGRGRGSSL